MKYLLLFFFFCFVVSCDKTPTNPLPPAHNPKPSQTQNGANILWGKIESIDTLYAYGQPSAITGNGVYALGRLFIDNQYALYISAITKQKNNLSLLVSYGATFSDTVRLNNKYPLKDHLNNYTSAYSSSGITYQSDTNNSYIIFTRFDSLVVAGTFEFHGINDLKDTIHITEGYFDITR